MIRRSLAQLLRIRQTTTCISSCKVSFLHSNVTLSLTRPTSYCFESQSLIHSSAASLYNNNRHINNGGGERKWGSNSNSNKQRYNADKSGELSPNCCAWCETPSFYTMSNHVFIMLIIFPLTCFCSTTLYQLYPFPLRNIVS